MKSVRRGLIGGAAAVALGAGFVGVAEAQTTQEGLVNVNLSNISVQVPVAVAANICDVNVGVLVGELRDRSAPCDADASSDATVTPVESGPVNQRGLVNVNATDVAVQVPIGIAANICDVNVAVLVNEFIDTATPCLTDADGFALVTPIA
jgi:hypothetical protein